MFSHFILLNITVNDSYVLLLTEKSLEWEIEKVQNSMVSTEQLEGLQKTFDEFQTIMQHNISRLRDTFQKTREVAAKQRANMKTQGKLIYTPSFIKSIFESLWLQCDLG